MNKKKVTDMCNTTAQTNKNTSRLFIWSVVWVLVTAGVAFGPKNIWNFNTWLTIIAVLIHIGIGLGMIRVFKQFLLGLDELQRKIHLDAMALSLGIGLVFGCSYEMLEDIKLIPFQPEIPHLIIVMYLTYAIGAILGNRRYQ
ncbi:MAG: hypothetical protein VX961_07875 [Verrucomicrobiota bacterium]|nr:hypothetical protein [Verrucomicrobiota bacterium]